MLTLALFSLSAMGETVINYDDGSTYTLGTNEKIYISTVPIFKQSTLDNGKKVLYTKQTPWATRDYVPQPIDPFTTGSHNWCKAYVPWSEGYTFNMQTWDRHCDTNNDGEYGCGDTKFDASEDGASCN